MRSSSEPLQNNNKLSPSGITDSTTTTTTTATAHPQSRTKQQ